MKKVALLGLVLVAVISLFAYMKVYDATFFAPSPTQSVASSPTPSVSPTPLLQTKIVPLVIKHNVITKGPHAIYASKNELIVFQITSDTDDTLSLLGYGKEVLLQKGKMVVLSFLSTLSGDFSYELQHANTILGSIHISK